MPLSISFTAHRFDKLVVLGHQRDKARQNRPEVLSEPKFGSGAWFRMFLWVGNGRFATKKHEAPKPEFGSGGTVTKLRRTSVCDINYRDSVFPGPGYTGGLVYPGFGYMRIHMPSVAVLVCTF